MRQAARIRLPRQIGVEPLDYPGTQRQTFGIEPPGIARTKPLIHRGEQRTHQRAIILVQPGGFYEQRAVPMRGVQRSRLFNHRH